MKNICLLLLTGLPFLACAQNQTGMQAVNAAMLANNSSIDVYFPGKSQVFKKPLSVNGAGLKDVSLHRAPVDKKTRALSRIDLDGFRSLATLTGRERTSGSQASLSVFNNAAYNAETGVYLFNTQDPKWKGRPYVYCSNCGTAVLQLQVEKNKTYLIQVSMASEKENSYELFSLPDLLSPEIMKFSRGAQELVFMIEPKETGYISYYLRCVEATAWSLSRVEVWGSKF